MYSAAKVGLAARETSSTRRAMVLEAGTPVTFEITPKTLTITINGSSDSKVYNGSEQTSETEVTPSCSDSLFDASKFSYTGATTITETAVGTYT